MKLIYFMQQFLFNENEIGIDEAGRGPLCGNVYAGAVIWNKDLVPPQGLITDSKKLSKKKRKLAFEWIITNVKYFGIGYATNEEIDNINILEATKLAMDRAIDNLKVKLELDGKHLSNNFIIDGVGWEKKFSGFNVKSIVKGDSKFLSIAAASILAKETHDEHINDLCKKDTTLVEKYRLDSNMGYGSKSHIDGIKKYGLSQYHRKSFKVKGL